MARARATIDHQTLKAWVEERGGCPAHVKSSGSKDDPGILRIDYPGFTGQKTLETISWEQFFEAFEDNELAFLYQDDKDSRFSKLVARSTAELEDEGNGRAARKSGTSGGMSNGVDALELLEDQHREVEELFDELVAARSDSQKMWVFTKLANALAAHTKIEETIFYPSVFDEDTEEELRESVEEHLVAKRLTADLLDMEPSDPQFMSKAAVLQDIVQRHIDEEEQELFEELREQEGEDLEVLGSKMQERYEQLIKGEPKNELPSETEAAVVSF
ncbi:MAG TPA: hemerythrin domain-containing protein [Kofleriaceae bacterium]|nr:hemerythrin domain-containing protein [Kofleriaceae bacterium]